MLNYVINERTLAIVPFGLKKSIVYEDSQKYVVSRHPNGIIRQNCILYGSTLDEKLRKTEILTGYTYKAPIIINKSNNLVFFPTSSPRIKDCAWINPLKIKDYKFNNEKSTIIIEFLNGQKTQIIASKRIIDNQILRSSRLIALSSVKPNFFD